jgi:two-component system chemotaxis response regulator CheY
LRILIVDDSTVIRRIVESALRQAGLDLAEFLHAANGIEGLAALERAIIDRRPVNLILSDLHMPLMNGLDFLLEKQRRNLAPGAPMVMITADGADPQVLKAIAAGAQGYISKPFTLQQIQTRVASVLQAAVPSPAEPILC